MEAWQKLAAAGGAGRIERAAPGRMIFGSGDAATEAFVLLEGCVEVVHLLDDGRSLVVKLLVAPTLFGAIEVLAGEPLYLESVRPLVGSRLCRLPAATVRSLHEQYPALARETLIDTATAFCAAARAEPGTVATIDALLARLFLAYVDLFGARVPAGVRIGLRRTQHDFAGSVGASERQVQRLLVDWKRRGLIGKSNGYYVVRKEAALGDIAGPLAGSLIHPPRHR